MKKTMQGMLIAGLLTIGINGVASAALPEPQDPRVVANMTFEQRLQMSKELRQQFKNATPEERHEYRQKMRAKFQALSFDERKALREKMHTQWQALSPEQKKELQDNRKAMIADLSPQEREEMKKHREDWKKNHPDGKGGWNAPMAN